MQLPHHWRLVLLLFPTEGLRLLLSMGTMETLCRGLPNAADGLGLSIFGIVSVRAEALYPRTLYDPCNFS